MRTKTDSKDSSLRPLGRMKSDQHIPGVAMFLFAVCLLVLVLGVLNLTQRAGTSDLVMGTWTVGWILLGAYFLYLAQDRLAVGKGRRPAPGQVP